MPEQLIAIAGAWFLAACALEALATFVEVAGAARSPEEEAPRGSSATFALLAVAALTPGLLLAHGFLSTHGAEPMLRVLALAAPAVALVGGAVLGGVFGAIARPATMLMRKLAVPFAVAALAVTIYATFPSIVLLTEAARSGGIIELAPE